MKKGSIVKGFGISFCLIIISIILSLVFSIYAGSLYVGSVFNENSRFSNPIFGILGSFSIIPFSTIFLFLILNSIGVGISKDYSTKKGMLYGYFLVLLPVILFLVIAFLATGYH
ncbi:MAG: hypothetical protein Q7S27_05150 [Nanoarchaeota archaeon]|nr:hypothetical protein [Nanoarchaeota archaeon]